VFVTQQLCYGLREVAELAKRIGKDDVVRESETAFETFSKRLNEVAWDGEWYLRTLCGDDQHIGSKDSPEGSIYLNPQSWSVLSGTASEERAKQAMAKVDEMLESDLGYRICYPPYSQWNPRVGRMSASMPGANENGGCYNHAAGFKGVADCLLGRAEQAWDTFVKVTPDNPENPISKSGAEPFNYVNSYSSVPFVYGQSGYAWRTGTSGWMATLMVEYILGARRGYDGLVIDPCLTKRVPRAKVTRQFRGATFEIELDNSAGRCSGVSSIELDGEKLEGSVLPLLTEGVHQVKVVI
jgi:cellobiose phosphorylase